MEQLVEFLKVITMLMFVTFSAYSIGYDMGKKEGYRRGHLSGYFDAMAAYRRYKRELCKLCHVYEGDED